MSKEQLAGLVDEIRWRCVDGDGDWGNLEAKDAARIHSDLRAILAQQPAGPVGAEGIEAVLHRVYMDHPDSRLTTTMIHDMAAAVVQSLAQQQPSIAPVGVEVAKAYCKECNAAGMGNCAHFDECGGARCITCHQQLNQQPAAVDGAWRQKAAEWLEAKAAQQEANNQRWPEHAAAYKAWRERPGVLRQLASEVLAAQPGGVE